MPFNRTRLDSLLSYIAIEIGPNLADELDRIYLELEDKITELERSIDEADKERIL
jgi:hypothetical protein